MDATEFGRILRRKRENLAFIVGNGINHYAYQDNKSVDWNNLLLYLWEKFSFRTRSVIPEGISMTEFYDLLELEAGSMGKVKEAVISYFADWKPVKYHHELSDCLSVWNVPVLTTNFDLNLSSDLNLKNLPEYKFTDFYPWGSYWSNNDLTDPVSGFGIWHINGMVNYKRSIRLGLTEYTSLASRTRQYLHSNDSLESFDLKNRNHWQGYHTWLHIIFNKSLCIFGLGLGKDETYLRWLLIERMKYFKKFPDRRHQGWYVCLRTNNNEGNRQLLDFLGLEVVELEEYKDIYERMLGIS